MNIHPLDREDEDTEPAFDHSSIGNGRVNRHERLFRFSVRAVVGAGILVLLSSVALTNIRYGTWEWNVASAANRATMLLLLLAFVGILASFQTNRLIRARNALAGRARTDMVPMNSSDKKPAVPGDSLAILLYACGLFLVLLWFLVGIASIVSSPIFFWLASLLGAMFPGLLITMIVWHRGCCRAFAIGALPVICWWVASTIVFSLYGFYGPNMSFTSSVGNQLSGFMIYTGIVFSFAVCSGLICAVYVRGLSWFRESTGEK